MTVEHTPLPPSEPAFAPGLPDDLRADVAGSNAGSPTPVQLRMQILTTEHWSLLASRGLAWNETFARAGMYLSTLSGAMVALGLVAGVDKLGDVFVTFALVILPVVLFVGIATFLRMGAANYHDAMTVHGMNRIRGAYLEIAPELEPYFVMGVHDDPVGIGITMAMPPGMPGPLHVISATPVVVTVLNGVVLGAIVAIVALRGFGLGIVPTLVVVGAAFVATVLGLGRIARSNIRRGQRLVRPMFPTPGQPVAGVPAESSPLARSTDRPTG